MGTSKGDFRKLLIQRDPSKAKAPVQGMRPVGSNADKTPVDVTVIYRNETGRWVYGEEVKADRATRTRVLPRGQDGSEDRFYVRLEYEFTVDRLKRAGGGRPATLVYAAMPPGFATVFLTPLQTYWAKESMTKLPDAYDTTDGEDLAAKFNPLGFTPEDLEERQADPDLKAIARIAGAQRDIYLTKSTFYRASFAGTLVSEAFHDYNRNALDTRWVRGQSKTHNTHDDERDDGRRRGPEEEHRLGLVLADIGTIESVAAEIILGLNDFRDRLEQAIRNGSFRHAGQRIKLDPNLESHIDYAIELGVWQALAGTDERQGVHEDEEVGALARRYAEYHLVVWNKTLIKETAIFRWPMPVDANGEPLERFGAKAADQDQFENLELLARLENAATERERLLLEIEILKTGDLRVSPEEIASYIHIKQQQIRKIDNAAG